MKLGIPEIREKLHKSGLKVTPQRIAILEAVHSLGNHPTAENIIEYIRSTHPNIASGTVYKVLDVLVRKRLINRVKTEKDVMRYDGIMEEHHHLYCSDSERIEDYEDPDLDGILQAYFRKKGIPGFRIEEIRLQIKGSFTQSAAGQNQQEKTSKHA